MTRSDVLTAIEEYQKLTQEEAADVLRLERELQEDPMMALKLAPYQDSLREVHRDLSILRRMTEVMRVAFLAVWNDEVKMFEVIRVHKNRLTSFEAGLRVKLGELESILFALKRSTILG